MKYKWYKTIEAKIKKHSGDKVGQEYIIIGEYEGRRREFTLSISAWTEAQERGGLPVT